MKGEGLLWRIAGRRSYYKFHINIYVLVNFGLFMINYFLMPHNLIFLWVTLVWGVLLLIQGVLISKVNNVDMELRRKLEKEEELKAQHTTYLLRLLGFSTDILRCVYDKEKLNAQHDNAEDHISNIKKKVDNFIDGYIQN